MLGFASLPCPPIGMQHAICSCSGSDCCNPFQLFIPQISSFSYLNSNWTCIQQQTAGRSAGRRYIIRLLARIIILSKVSLRCSLYFIYLKYLEQLGRSSPEKKNSMKYTKSSSTADLGVEAVARSQKPTKCKIRNTKYLVQSAKYNTVLRNYAYVSLLNLVYQLLLNYFIH